MVDILLKRYIWLIDTLRKRGEMTYDEIASAWSHSSVNDNGTELSKRTFYIHCQAIARHFGIDIECRRGRGLNLYRISNPESIEENSLTKWVLDSFSLGELLLGNTDNTSTNKTMLLLAQDPLRSKKYLTLNGAPQIDSNEISDKIVRCDMWEEYISNYK
ncbi:MAG: hypothetical protein HDS56_06770 [Barnesiella sp.]|nr:hypothetical protein [Barnesiella sp.]